MSMTMVNKTTRAFRKALGIVSVIGFMGIIFDAAGVLDFNHFVASGMFIVLGIGLMLEGRIFKIVKMVKDGVDVEETAHILSILVGVFSVIIGLSNLFMISSAFFASTKILIAALAIVMIIIEVFWVN